MWCYAYKAGYKQQSNFEWTMVELTVSVILSLEMGHCSRRIDEKHTDILINNLA